MLSKEFVLAGKAIFTVYNEQTDVRYTFKVTKKEPRKSDVLAWMHRHGLTEEQAKAEIGPTFFVNFLTGPDNENDYTYLGMLNAATGVVRTTRASRMGDDSLPVIAANWTLRQIWRQNALQPHVFLAHAGRCGRCARLLTVPSSIESGIGPECQKHMHA